MTRKSVLALTASLTMGLTPLYARALLIDTFETQQTAVGSTSGGCPSNCGSTLTSPAGSLAGTRTVGSFGTGDFQTSAGVGNGKFGSSVSFASGGSSFGSVAWTLFSPMDVTDGGTSQRFLLDVGAPTPGVPTSLAISLEGAQVVVPITGAGVYSVPLSSFTSDLRVVGRILLTFSFQTTGPASISLTGPFQTVPEPGAALFASAFALLGLLARRA